MATIKSYTDIEQSKKLAEILPLESADMWYQHTGISIKDGSQKPIYFPMIIRDCESDEDIPCWSLAALLGALPRTINFGYENDSIFVLRLLDNGKYLADYYEVSYVKDNPIDACYEMIIRLNELNLL